MKRFLIFCLFFVACDGPSKYKSHNNRTSLTGDWQYQKLQLGEESFQVFATWLTPLKKTKSFSSSILVRVLNSKSQLIDLPQNINLEFYAWMPSMGHPLSDAGFFEKISEGMYLNKNIVFNMAGEWEMQLLLWGPNDNILQKLSWKELW